MPQTTTHRILQVIVTGIAAHCPQMDLVRSHLMIILTETHIAMMLLTLMSTSGTTTHIHGLHAATPTARVIQIF